MKLSKSMKRRGARTGAFKVERKKTGREYSGAPRVTRKLVVAFPAGDLVSWGGSTHGYAAAGDGAGIVIGKHSTYDGVFEVLTQGRVILVKGTRLRIAV